MTFTSAMHHFLDKHATSLSNKEYFQNWRKDVSEASDRPIVKVEVCKGVTMKDVSIDEWEHTVERFDVHYFLQVTLAETAHHQPQAVLIERVKGGDGVWPHSAIPLPVDRISSIPSVSFAPQNFDIACVLKHGSHGSDVVSELEVLQTLVVQDMTAHELVHVFETSDFLTGFESACRVTCADLSREFTDESMRVLTDYAYLHHRLAEDF